MLVQYRLHAIQKGARAQQGQLNAAADCQHAGTLSLRQHLRASAAYQQVYGINVSNSE